MILTLQLEESLAKHLQKQAMKQKVSLTNFIHHFLDVHWGRTEQDEVANNNESEQPNIDEKDEVVLFQDHSYHQEQQGYVDDDDEYWEHLYAELREMDPELEDEIDRVYGTGTDLLHNTAGIFGKGLPDEEVRYIVESPELSQQSLWITSHNET